MTFRKKIGSEGLRHITDVCPRSWILRRKIVCSKQVYEIDHAEISLSISAISFIISFSKAGEFLLMF